MPSIRPNSGKKVSPSKGTDASDKLLSGGQIEGGYLYVTDGAQVMRYPVHAASKVSEGYVPREALLHIERDQADFAGNMNELRVGGKTPSRWSRDKPGQVIDGAPRVVYSRFEPVFTPTQPRQFPTLHADWPEECEGARSITVDTKQLRGIAIALGLDKVTIEFDPEGKDDRLIIRGRNEHGAAVAMQPWRADA